MRLPLLLLSFIVVVPSVAMAEDLYNARMNVAQASCSNSDIDIHIVLVNREAREKEFNITFYNDDYSLRMTENAFIPSNRTFERDRIVSLFFPQGINRIKANITDGESITFLASDFTIGKCEGKSLETMATSIIHKNIARSGIEAWQLFLVLFVFANVVFTEFGSSLGKPRTIKVAPALFVSLLITASAMFI